MRAMVLEKPGTPLRLMEMPIPEPQNGEILISINACAICRTDLHIADGELDNPKLPLILGHQIVGHVVKRGPNALRFSIGDRVGVPWLGKSCGQCNYCQTDRENLCSTAYFTGYNINGGFADYCIAYEQFCFPLPPEYSDTAIAPLLCGGLIGFRALRLAGSAQRIGFFGFGSAAHLLIQIARHQGKQIYAFTREGDTDAQKLAMQLGAEWVGSSDQHPPCLLDAALIFAPAGKLVPTALAVIDKGGSVICAGIHMSDIPRFPYVLLYGERILRSVTNLTRDDGMAFFDIIKHCPIKTKTTLYPLERANEALNDLRSGNFTGSAVLVNNSSNII